MLDSMDRNEGNPLGAMLRVGIVSETDYETGRIRCTIPDLDDFVTPWLFVLVPKTGKDKAFWMPEVEDQVALLLDAEARTGFVLGSIYSTVDEIPEMVDSETRWHVQMEDGTTIDYNRETSEMTVDCVGDVIVKSDKNVTVEAAQKITIEGAQVAINGAVKINGLCPILIPC